MTSRGTSRRVNVNGALLSKADGLGQKSLHVLKGRGVTWMRDRLRVERLVWSNCPSVNCGVGGSLTTSGEGKECTVCGRVCPVGVAAMAAVVVCLLRGSGERDISFMAQSNVEYGGEISV